MEGKEISVKVMVHLLRAKLEVNLKRKPTFEDIKRYVDDKIFDKITDSGGTPTNAIFTALTTREVLLEEAMKQCTGEEMTPAGNQAAGVQPSEGA